MDGRKQAHMDVLVAVPEKGFHTGATTKFEAKKKKNPAKPEAKRGFRY